MNTGEYKKIYYINNREHLLNYAQQYRENNKDILLEKAKKIIVCKCGEKITYAHLARHNKTKLHIDIMKMQELD